MQDTNGKWSIDWGQRRFILLAAAPLVIYFAIIPIYAAFHAELYASDIPRLLRYVVVPAAISLSVALIALFVRREVAISLVLGALAVLAALFAFEALLTARALSASLGQVGYLPEGQALPSDVRGALPPAYTSKALDRDLGVTSLDAAILGGLPERKVLLCSRGGKPVTYMADRYGYNNPEMAYETRVDLLIIGDSFVEGICLPPGEDLVSRVRQQLGGVVGMGTRGAGPLVELATLGRYGPSLKPRHVVLAFFAGNDWENLEHEKKMRWLSPALDKDVSFGPTQLDPEFVQRASVKVGEWWDEGDQNVGELFERRAVLRNFFALQQTALNLGLHFPKASPEQPEFEEVLVRAVDITASWGGNVSLAYIPHVSQFFGGAANASYDDLHKKVTTAAERAGVPVIDLQAAFLEYPEPLSFYAEDAHFSEAGAALAADVISRHFMQVAADNPPEEETLK